MSNINICTFSGNVVRDMVVRTTASGASVGNFTLAVNERRKVNGIWEDVPNYFDMTIFGESAARLSKYITKGQKVSIAAKAQWKKWQDNNGNNRDSVTFIVSSIDIHFRGKNNEQDTIVEVTNEDIPF